MQTFYTVKNWITGWFSTPTEVVTSSNDEVVHSSTKVKKAYKTNLTKYHTHRYPTRQGHQTSRERRPVRVQHYHIQQPR